MDKAFIERVCANAGLQPARREKICGHDVLIADGFSAEPHVTFRRFGVDKGEFSWGCYATIWWIAHGDKIEIGVPMMFDAFHNPEYDAKTKKLARVNTALKEAAGFLKRREKVAKG